MNGVLPDTSLKALIESGAISAEQPILPEQIQPASLDLRLGRSAWRLRASFLSGRGRKVSDRLADFEMHRMDLSGGAVLEKGCVYLVPLMERLALPKGLDACQKAMTARSMPRSARAAFRSLCVPACG